MDAAFALYGLAALGAVVMLAFAGRRSRDASDEGPRPDPSLGVALDAHQPGINNQGML
ncbi:hypothetical protein [uncultured Microbacterium sp.]|uniref:hypothetical protein n=1 Tax=uncultured Microbacterium sp. TaxID=191216 RepID=UPI0028DB3C7D|nr:hypothetical protein [uncultured Microbacterium sp.]